MAAAKPSSLVDTHAPQRKSAMKRKSQKRLPDKTGSLDDQWMRVHSVEYLEQRRFDPLAKTFGALNEEYHASLLKWIQRDADREPLHRTLIHELLFELAWRSDFRRTSEPFAESMLWDDLRGFIQRERNRTGGNFDFPLWVVHVGRMLAAAWMRRDWEFFVRHASLWRALCETKDKEMHRPATHIAAICRCAIALHTQLGHDPTKKEVRDEVARRELHISEKDWPKYFRKCFLTFLPQAKGGRPKSLRKLPDSRKLSSDSKRK